MLLLFVHNGFKNIGADATSLLFHSYRMQCSKFSGIISEGKPGRGQIRDSAHILWALSLLWSWAIIYHNINGKHFEKYINELTMPFHVSVFLLKLNLLIKSL
jgi:hypothetical protein